MLWLAEFCQPSARILIGVLYVGEMFLFIARERSFESRWQLLMIVVYNVYLQCYTMYKNNENHIRGLQLFLMLACDNSCLKKTIATIIIQTRLDMNFTFIYKLRSLHNTGRIETSSPCNWQCSLAFLLFDKSQLSARVL